MPVPSAVYLWNGNVLRAPGGGVAVDQNCCCDQEVNECFWPQCVLDIDLTIEFTPDPTYCDPDRQDCPVTFSLNIASDPWRNFTDGACVLIDNDPQGAQVYICDYLPPTTATLEANLSLPLAFSSQLNGDGCINVGAQINLLRCGMFGCVLIANASVGTTFNLNHAGPCCFPDACPLPGETKCIAVPFDEVVAPVAANRIVWNDFGVCKGAWIATRFSGTMTFCGNIDDCIPIAP